MAVWRRNGRGSWKCAPPLCGVTAPGGT